MAIRSLNGVGIHVVEDPERLAAGWLVHTASEPGHIALGGGTSVGRVYELAAELQPEWRRRLARSAVPVRRLTPEQLSTKGPHHPPVPCLVASCCGTRASAPESTQHDPDRQNPASDKVVSK